MLYRSTGSIPIEFLIQKRRLVYLQHILKQDNDSLLNFFLTSTPNKKVKRLGISSNKNLDKFEIILKFEEILNMQEETWKLKVKNKSIKIALEYLNSNQGSKN